MLKNRRKRVSKQCFPIHIAAVSEGCVCPEGQILLGSKCLTTSECGCINPNNGQRLFVSTKNIIYMCKLFINSSSRPD